MTAVSGAVGGTAVLDDNGTPADKTDDFVRFTPTADLCGAGAGRYDYTVSDGSLTDSGHVTVNITCVNDAPVADDETISTNEDTAVDTLVSYLLTGDTDIDSATLTVTAVSGAVGGTAVLNDTGTPPDKSDDYVRFTPTANLCGAGAGRYDYTVSDGSLTDTGHVTVDITCVNDAPVADDETISTNEDTAVNTLVSSLLTGDTDIDSATLTVTAVSGAVGGTAVLNDTGTPADKSDDFVRFTPDRQPVRRRRRPLRLHRLRRQPDRQRPRDRQHHLRQRRPGGHALWSRLDDRGKHRGVHLHGFGRRFTDGDCH